MLGRIVHKSDFQRVLATSPCARSTHFAAYHVAARPFDARYGLDQTNQVSLSTDPEEQLRRSVDKVPRPDQLWAGFVLPKRLARRSVTRQLLKRQAREALRRRAHALPPGLWIVRLRNTFDRTEFVSASSSALRRAARAELDALMVAAARR